jgi:quercetin dioxygenase-like cupin family protein
MDAAQSDLLRSVIFDWNGIAPQPTPTGAKRPFFRGRTATLDRLACHVSTLNPGQSAHPPHRHVEEELIIVKEGTLDALHDGKTTRMSAGSVLFIAPQDLHGVTNPGPAQATYYVLKWFPPGMLEASK